MKNVLEQFRSRLFAKWVVCSIIPDKESVRYGIKFSYPIYILIVSVGTSLEDRFVLSTAGLIALLAIKLPLHPFDYAYNYGVAKLIGSNEIPGRGSESQVNGMVALIFCSIVLALITLGVSVNYGVLAVVYVLSSIFFIGIFLLKD